ncbi:unnamed protein product, partial [Symbiodinium sp. CCMP2456]
SPLLRTSHGNVLCALAGIGLGLLVLSGNLMDRAFLGQSSDAEDGSRLSPTEALKILKEHGLLTEAEFAAKEAVLASASGTEVQPPDSLRPASGTKTSDTLSGSQEELNAAPEGSNTIADGEVDRDTGPDRSPTAAFAPAPAAAPQISQLSAAVRHLPRLPSHRNAGPGNSLVYRAPEFQSLPALTDEALEASQALASQDYPQLYAMLLRLARNQTIRLQVYGGSMTYGEGCCTSCDTRNNHCSWSAQFADYLRTAFQGRVQLDNRGRGGCDMTCALPDMVLSETTATEPLDMMLLDFSQNGWGISKTGKELEEFVRACHLFLPKTLFVVFWNRDMIDGEKAAKIDARLFEGIRILGQHYSVPVLNYEAILELYAKEARVVEELWPGWKTRHPTWQAHAYFADVLAYWCNKQLEKLERLPEEETARLLGEEFLPQHRTPSPDLKDDLGWIKPVLKADLATAPVCLFPLSQHIARSPGPSTPRQSPKGEWSLFEDRRNKPGWISNTTDGEELVFDLKFSSKPMIMIQYLRSYTNIGEAEVTVQSPWIWRSTMFKNLRGYKWRMLARWPTKISVTQNAFFKAVTPTSQLEGRKDSATISFRLARGPKFKLLSVISC